MASLKEIAAAVGVSYTVVSKVLSGRLGKTRVSKATHAAIIKKAAELNYTPNRLAVALKAGRKGAVGIFLHHFGNAGSDVVDRMLRGISGGLEQSGLRMWLRFFNTDQEFFLACDSKLHSEVDGLIVAGPYHPGMMPKLRELVRHGTPVVSITNDIPASQAKILSNVSVNYESQGLLPTRHLINQGCRKLACFDTNPVRTAGFKRAHKEARLPLDPRFVIPAEDYTLQSGEKSVRKLLKLGQDFDGIVCHSDAQAFAAINELARLGMKVPKQVKVTGVDNSPLAELCLVPITSATSAMQRAGQAAVDTLLQKINGQTVPPTVLEPGLILRRSSRAAGLKENPQEDES